MGKTPASERHRHRVDSTNFPAGRHPGTHTHTHMAAANSLSHTHTHKHTHTHTCLHTLIYRITDTPQALTNITEGNMEGKKASRITKLTMCVFVCACVCVCVCVPLQNCHVLFSLFPMWLVFKVTQRERAREDRKIERERERERRGCSTLSDLHG